METSPTPSTEVKTQESFFKKHPIISIIAIIIAIGAVMNVMSDTKQQAIQTAKEKAEVRAEEEVQERAQEEAAQQAAAVAAEAAQKELDELIDLSKTAGLVSSYEFSERASVVYVTDVWYTQTVQFKKDFLAKVGGLKQTITGYKHFEVRHANSNEKVAELTSFTGSLEVYK
jgi:hypothetical protein